MSLIDYEYENCFAVYELKIESGQGMGGGWLLFWPDTVGYAP